jgi:hypothetical protein
MVKTKGIKSLWAEFSYVTEMKATSLGFLNADDIIVAFCNLVPERFPLVFCIYSSDVPIEDFPCSVMLSIINKT